LYLPPRSAIEPIEFVLRDQADHLIEDCCVSLFLESITICLPALFTRQGLHELLSDASKVTVIQSTLQLSQELFVLWQRMLGSCRCLLPITEALRVVTRVLPQATLLIVRRHDQQLRLAMRQTMAISALSLVLHRSPLDRSLRLRHALHMSVVILAARVQASAPLVLLDVAGFGHGSLDRSVPLAVEVSVVMVHVMVGGKRVCLALQVGDLLPDR